MTKEPTNEDVALAMGWTQTEVHGSLSTDLVWYTPKLEVFEQLPDFLHDANADYTVLKWVRENLDKDSLTLFSLELVVTSDNRWQEKGSAYYGRRSYEPGDYSRARVEVKEKSDE